LIVGVALSVQDVLRAPRLASAGSQQGPRANAVLIALAAPAASL
jgi:hypothetical protein